MIGAIAKVLMYLLWAWVLVCAAVGAWIVFVIFCEMGRRKRVRFDEDRG